MKEGYLNLVEEIKNRRNSGLLIVETLQDTGNWFQKNFSMKDIVEVTFHNPNMISIKRPPKRGSIDIYNWSRLNHLQIGRYAEYLVKMELTQYGLDVYTSEIDDRGIDFVLRLSASHYVDIQVKASRNLNYIFFPKKSFHPRKNFYAAIVLFQDGEPADHYLIPSLAWLDPNDLLVSRDYKEAASSPEWGMNLSYKNLKLLDHYSFDKSIASLVKEADFGSP